MNASTQGLKQELKKIYLHTYLCFYHIKQKILFGNTQAVIFLYLLNLVSDLVDINAAFVGLLLVVTVPALCTTIQTINTSMERAAQTQRFAYSFSLTLNTGCKQHLQEPREVINYHAFIITPAEPFSMNFWSRRHIQPLQHCLRLFLRCPSLDCAHLQVKCT